METEADIKEYIKEKISQLVTDRAVELAHSHRIKPENIISIAGFPHEGYDEERVDMVTLLLLNSEEAKKRPNYRGEEYVFIEAEDEYVLSENGEHRKTHGNDAFTRIDLGAEVDGAPSKDKIKRYLLWSGLPIMKEESVYWLDEHGDIEKIIQSGLDNYSS